MVEAVQDQYQNCWKKRRKNDSVKILSVIVVHALTQFTTLGWKFSPLWMWSSPARTLCSGEFRGLPFCILPLVPAKVSIYKSCVSSFGPDLALLLPSHSVWFCLSLFHFQILGTKMTFFCPRDELNWVSALGKPLTFSYFNLCLYIAYFDPNYVLLGPMKNLNSRLL